MSWTAGRVGTPCAAGWATTPISWTAQGMSCRAPGGGTDTVHSGASHTLSANVENLVLTGTGGSSGTGNALNNTLTATSAQPAERLRGQRLSLRGDGNDTLDSGSGNDTLNGGTGRRQPAGPCRQ